MVPLLQPTPPIFILLYINPFLSNVFILYPLKTPENQSLSVFLGCIKCQHQPEIGYGPEYTHQRNATEHRAIEKTYPRKYSEKKKALIKTQNWIERFLVKDMKRVYVYQNCFAQDRFSRKVKNDRKCYKKLSQTRFLVFSKILRYGYFNQEKERNWGKSFFRSLFICIRYRA